MEASDRQEQLAWESRWAKPAAAAAFGTVALLIAGTVFRQAGALSSRPEDDRELLLAIDANAGEFIGSSFVQALSFVTLAAVLLYLGRAVHARRPELPRILVWLGVAGPLLLAVAGVLSDFDRVDIADEFAASGAQTVERANDLLEDRSVGATSLGSVGTLVIAIAFVFLSINAMRVGLLTRFMGAIGAVVGALYVLPLLFGPLVVQLFWLLALGVLFLGRWPGDRGPAWSTGEAIPWPSAFERRQALEQGADQEGTSVGEPAPANGGAGNGAAQGPSRKRKKKRR